MKIVLASAGRRAYYAEWFRDALRSEGIDGEVIALEYSATSPSFGVADRAVQMPAYNSREYPEAIRSWFAENRPDVFFCMNDYEIQILAGGLAQQLRDLGCLVPVLAQEKQAMVLDKYRMSTSLGALGVPTPVTYLGSEVDAVVAAAAPDARYVVKHRFGAGSTGLAFPGRDGLREAVASSAESALGEDGFAAADGVNAVIIQDFLPGDEYGIDGVFSLDGRSELMGVLARRVDKLRNGDPDVATSMPAEPFHGLVATVGEVLEPSGSINLDVRAGTDGVYRVIDINPRLGGGYPFCHRAGADLPAALIRAVRGLPHDPELLSYEYGVTTARREEFTAISCNATGEQGRDKRR